MAHGEPSPGGYKEGYQAGYNEALNLPKITRDWKAEYEGAVESRADAVKREEEATSEAAAWKAAYWALVTAIRRL